MGAGAWVMFAIGAIFLWGGLVVAIMNYLRAAGNQNRNS